MKTIKDLNITVKEFLESQTYFYTPVIINNKNGLPIYHHKNSIELIEAETMPIILLGEAKIISFSITRGVISFLTDIDKPSLQFTVSDSLDGPEDKVFVLYKNGKEVDRYKLNHLDSVERKKKLVKDGYLYCFYREGIEYEIENLQLRINRLKNELTESWRELVYAT